uniref:Uncharacterized protein n=1 Tax=Ditylenchus dipsaci TaxID=166011 RepID=A0A915DD96_9BILA
MTTAARRRSSSVATKSLSSSGQQHWNCATYLTSNSTHGWSQGPEQHQEEQGQDDEQIIGISLHTFMSQRKMITSSTRNGNPTRSQLVLCLLMGVVKLPENPCPSVHF